LKQAKAVTWKVHAELTHESADGSALEPTTSLVATQSLLVKPETQTASETKTIEDGWSVLAIDCTYRVKHLSWHGKGDYFASVSTINTDASHVLIHRLTQHQTQSPFSKSKGLVMQVQFHPSKPFFFVLTKRHIRIYNLVAQNLVKKLLCPAKWLSSMSIHPGGDHIIAGSFDRKVCWYDLDLSAAPYKTLKYHAKAVRSVHFHPTAPLFASCSDDGNIHVFHGRVYEDLTTDPLIVPVKIIKAHQPVNDVGVMSCLFHPVEPWIFSSGADQVIRLFTC
jgi:ribosome biogenesis protein ERB1